MGSGTRSASFREYSCSVPQSGENTSWRGTSRPCRSNPPPPSAARSAPPSKGAYQVLDVLQGQLVLLPVDVRILLQERDKVAEALVLEVISSMPFCMSNVKGRPRRSPASRPKAAAAVVVADRSRWTCSPACDSCGTGCRQRWPRSSEVWRCVPRSAAAWHSSSSGRHQSHILVSRSCDLVHVRTSGRPARGVDQRWRATLPMCSVHTARGNEPAIQSCLF